MAKSSTYFCDFVVGNEKQQKISPLLCGSSSGLRRGGEEEEEFVNGRKREGEKLSFQLRKCIVGRAGGADDREERKDF